MNAVIARALDRSEHGLRVIARGLQPRADHLASLAIRDTKTHEDGNAFAPKFVARIGVDRRGRHRRHRSVSYGIFL